MPFATANGVNLNYRVDGAGPPLVLIHGFSSSSSAWDPVMERLTQTFKVFRYDHRGHGDSGKPPGPYRIQDFVDDLEAILNYFGLEQVDLMGHSMGGRTALLFALQHGDRLNRLLLVGASGSAPEGDPQKRFETLKALARNEGMEAVFDSDLYAFALPEAWKEESVRTAARQRFLKNTPEGFCAAADAVLATPDMRERLGEISVPAWVCVGENDAGPLAFSELCQTSIPDCTRAIVPGCGHYPMVDAAEPFLAQLEAFLRKNPVHS